MKLDSVSSDLHLILVVIISNAMIELYTFKATIFVVMERKCVVMWKTLTVNISQLHISVRESTSRRLRC